VSFGIANPEYMQIANLLYCMFGMRCANIPNSGWERNKAVERYKILKIFIVKMSFSPFGVGVHGVYQPQVAPAVMHIKALRALPCYE
jgi:hypothetical protein